MLSIQLAQKVRNILASSQDIVPKNKIYLYNIPEDEQRVDSMPVIRINHITTSATVHSSNKLDMTRERFQVQYFFDDGDERDLESMIMENDRILGEEGFYFSNGYDSFDPDLGGVVIITRQYNYRNNYYNK